MTPREYASINMDTTPTTKYKAERIASCFARGENCLVYVLKDRDTGFYKASLRPADPELYQDHVEVYKDGKVLEMAF